MVENASKVTIHFDNGKEVAFDKPDVQLVRTVQGPRGKEVEISYYRIVVMA